MSPLGEGYWEAFVPGAAEGLRYMFVLDDGPARPDPASRYQPQGVHGPSEVLDLTAYPWADHDWKGLPLEEFIVYELHVGTFSPEGTFEGVLRQLPYLRELGITAVELMPVGQFPGVRNWGYDVAYPFAVQASYGGPRGLQRLVDACHRAGLAVVLDVVYNHLGPEGNYLGHYGPYFTDAYRTPWGPAINYDGPDSDHVRRYFMENIMQWHLYFHIDALRLDAVHGIFDHSARHVLQDFKEAARKASEATGRPFYVIAESDQNDPRLIRPPELGGYGLDACWLDDFHHALHVALTGQRDGYYQDFDEPLQKLLKAYREGFIYSGQYSRFRRRRHGASSSDRPAEQFVVFAQNHDQVGNRPLGDRLRGRALRLAAAAVLLGPYIPLLFMGEEYDEPAPFLYFVDHSDPALLQAVKEGRRREFEGFRWPEDFPEPGAQESFLQSRLNLALREAPGHREHLEFYKRLIRLRKELVGRAGRQGLSVRREGGLIILVRRAQGEEVLLGLNFAPEEAELGLRPPQGWQALLGPEPRAGGLKLGPQEAALLRRRLP
jgi:maltooligosyltrehalose trehalohydrolase